MYHSLLQITLLPLVLFTAVTNFCMELVSPQPQKKDSAPIGSLDRSELYRKNISANLELIRGFNHGNTHLVERTLPITKNKDLYYLLRPADNTFSQKPYLVSICPYEIASLNDDKETLAFLKDIKWPQENKPIGFMRKPTFLLLACIENNMSELKSLLSRPSYLPQQDKETLKDCLFVTIDNNRYNDDTRFISALFAHPDIHTYLLNGNLSEYIDFALNPVTVNRYGSPNFAAQTLKEISESYNNPPANNLKVDISQQSNAQKSPSQPRSYLSRVSTAAETLRPRLSRKKTNSTNAFPPSKTRTESTTADNGKEKPKDL
jgi:hypothetical protein